MPPKVRPNGHLVLESSRGPGSQGSGQGAWGCVRLWETSHSADSWTAACPQGTGVVQDWAFLHIFSHLTVQDWACFSKSFSLYCEVPVFLPDRGFCSKPMSLPGERIFLTQSPFCLGGTRAFLCGNCPRPLCCALTFWSRMLATLTSR